MLSKSWKPKKAKKITGPMVGRVDNAQKESAEDREALGLNGSNVKTKSGSNHNRETFQEQIAAERETQDDILD